MTPFWTHGSMRSRGGVDKWFSNGQSDVVSFFGQEADELYLPGKPASGNVVGEIGGNVLTPVTTPAYQQVLTGEADDPLGVGMTVGSTDSFDAANATVHDSSATSFAILVPFLTDATLPGGVRDILGKRAVASPNAGYELITSTTYIRAAYASSAGTRYCVVTADFQNGLHYALLGFDYNADESVLYTDLGSHALTTLANITTSAIFALGSCRSLASGVVIGPVVVWSGAAAEAVIADRATLLPAWWAS